MNGQQGPLSPPDSVASSEWSGLSQYRTTEKTYSPNLAFNHRGNLTTPPTSGSLNGNGVNGNSPHEMNGRPGGNRGNPSPPSSIARSSNGTTLSVDGQRRKQSVMEDSLAQHYVVLKRYLAPSLHQELAAGKPNRARDKLLRLSSVQFQELSTDVYDELLRRQAADRQHQAGPTSREPEVAPYLLPKDNFHPKRNQARQKLSTLPDLRFQALATDVFFELERRVPRFADGDIERRGSPAGSRRGPPSRTGTPTGMRPDSRGHGGASGPPGPGQRRPYPPRQGSLGGQVLAGHGIPGMGSQDDYSRPTPKSSQSNTIVPNKSYLVEDDDDQTGPEDNDSIYGSHPMSAGHGGKGSASTDRDKKMMTDYQIQVGELQGRVDELQSRMREKEAAIDRLEMSNRQLENDNQQLESNYRQRENEYQQLGTDHRQLQSSHRELERNQSDFERADADWTNLRTELEDKLTNALNLNNGLQAEIDKAQSHHAERERELQSQLAETSRPESGDAELESRYTELQHDYDDLQKHVEEQERITNEVRQEASTFLNEMRAISDRSGQKWAHQDQLLRQVHRLEEEVKEWKGRYARTKSQLRTLHAGSMGLAMEQPQVGRFAQDHAFTHPDGLIRDVHVIKFQLTMDELLRVSRSGDAPLVLDHMKQVVAAVRHICHDINDPSSSSSSPDADETAQALAKLRAKVSATANNFITASKNFAQSDGLSPVSLLDAAASHLASTVVELVRAVKLHATPPGELDDDEEDSLPDGSPGYFSANGHSSMTDSVYSHETLSQPYPSRPTIQTTPAVSPGNQARDHASAPVPPPKDNLPNGKNDSPVSGPGLNFGLRARERERERDHEIEDLKLFLEDQTDTLVASVQALVGSVRVVDEPVTIRDHVGKIASIVNHVRKETQRVGEGRGREALLRGPVGEVVRKLVDCRARLLAADEEGRGIGVHAEWRGFVGCLPPIAFEIAREVKGLGRGVEEFGGGVGGGEGKGLGKGQVGNGNGGGGGAGEEGDEDDFR